MCYFKILNNAPYEWIMDLHPNKFVTEEQNVIFGSHLSGNVPKREEDGKR